MSSPRVVRVPSTTAARAVTARWLGIVDRLRSQRALRRRQRRLYEARWSSLPAKLRTPQQLAGVRGVACGATHGIMERCNFACTSCYLTELANYTEPIPFTEARGQLDALRDQLGVGAKVQITSGEVTLLAPERLGRIVAYARSIGLDPMVMSNGQRLLQVPGYLEELVGLHGLEKIAFHVDTTQRGRSGIPPGARERDLHPVRDRFADLVRSVRHDTGARLHAAHTVTVTPDTLDDVPDVVAWALDNLDAFRLISFLPVAEVGRTRDRGGSDLSIDAVWAKVCEGFGRRLNRHALYFGHPQCNLTVPLVVARSGRRTEVLEIVREGKRWDLRFIGKALRWLGPNVDVDSGLWSNLPWLAWASLRQPLVAAEAILYGLYRLWGIRGWVGLLLAGLVGRRPLRIRPLMIVVHKFMNADELDTPVGRERLQACVLRVPVDGRMVPMCEINATPLRRALNERRLPRSASRPADRAAASRPADSAASRRA